MRILLSIFVLLACLTIQGQVVISSDPGVIADPSAMLTLDSDKGLLIPRMTEAERDAISSPAEGLWIYQTDKFPGYFIYSGSAWVKVSYDETLKGKVDFDDATGMLNGSGTGGYSGYTVTYPATGEFEVTFPPFDDIPVVMLTPEAIPALPGISGPEDYCQPTHNNTCNTFIAADYIDDVRIQSCPGGGANCTYIPPIGFQRNGTNCDVTADNYVNLFSNPLYEATVHGECWVGGTGSFYNLFIRSSSEWNDGVYMFIDWNQDGDFEDDSEVVLDEDTPSPADELVLASNGIVPSDAIDGVTVMRAITLFSVGVPAPCGNFPWGETEDYKLNVVGSCSGGSSAAPRACDCNMTDITDSGFKVFCTIVTSDKPVGTSFDFYVTEH